MLIYIYIYVYIIYVYIELDVSYKQTLYIKDYISFCFYVSYRVIYILFMECPPANGFFFPQQCHTNSSCQRRLKD